MPAPATALSALADPTRQLIIERLRRGPHAVGEIARGLPVSRPAVSQHLLVLRKSGLVREERVGRRNVYRLDARGLEPLRAFVDELWTDVLDAYRRAAEAEARLEETS